LRPNFLESVPSGLSSALGMLKIEKMVEAI
jgi:hypothetical protein